MQSARTGEMCLFTVLEVSWETVFGPDECADNDTNNFNARTEAKRNECADNDDKSFNYDLTTKGRTEAKNNASSIGDCHLQVARIY